MNRYILLIILFITCICPYTGASAEKKRSVDMVAYTRYAGINMDNTELYVRYLKTGKVVEVPLGCRIDYMTMDSEGKYIAYRDINNRLNVEVFDIEKQSVLVLQAKNAVDSFDWLTNSSVLGIATVDNSFKAIDLATQKIIYQAKDIPGAWAWWGTDSIIFVKTDQLTIRDFSGKILYKAKIPIGDFVTIMPSPNHRYILVNIYGKGLILLDMNGKSVKLPSNTSADYFDVCWSDDGTKIGYRKSRVIANNTQNCIGFIDLNTKTNKKLLSWSEELMVYPSHYSLYGWSGADCIIRKMIGRSPTCIRLNIHTRKTCIFYDFPSNLDEFQFHYSD